MTYISREAAIKLFNFAVLDCLGMEPTIRAGDIVKAIKSIPAADVREVVRGKWQFHMFTANSWGYECRVCHTTWDTPTNFCPNCGAEMKGEDDGN